MTPEPAPDTVATPEPAPEETTTPTAPVATLTVNEGLMEVSPECFDDDTPELTYQPDPDRHAVEIFDSSDGGSTTNRGLVAPLTLSVDNRTSIIFSTPTVHSANADLKFSARPTVIGTFGDVRIHYQRVQTWPDQVGPLPSLEFFSRSNPECFVVISFDANLVES